MKSSPPRNMSSKRRVVLGVGAPRLGADCWRALPGRSWPGARGRPCRGGRAAWRAAPPARRRRPSPYAPAGRPARRPPSTAAALQRLQPGDPLGCGFLVCRARPPRGPAPRAQQAGAAPGPGASTWGRPTGRSGPPPTSGGRGRAAAPGARRGARRAVAYGSGRGAPTGPPRRGPPRSPPHLLAAARAEPRRLLWVVEHARIPGPRPRRGRAAPAGLGRVGNHGAAESAPGRRGGTRRPSPSCMGFQGCREFDRPAGGHRLGHRQGQAGATRSCSHLHIRPSLAPASR